MSKKQHQNLPNNVATVLLLCENSTISGFRQTNKKRLLHECSCIVEFVKIEEKRYNARLAEHLSFFATSLINSIIQEHEY